MHNATQKENIDEYAAFWEVLLMLGCVWPSTCAHNKESTSDNSNTKQAASYPAQSMDGCWLTLALLQEEKTQPATPSMLCAESTFKV
eukprot:1145375-Pelagomonas_calceolata.AAC.2